MTVLIFANGVLDEVNWIRPYLPTATAVIAADGGARHLLALDWPPDVIVGDMDSITDDIRAWLTEAGAQFNTHPPAKDETDLELALLYAASHFDDEIWLLGTLGGRLDQTLANILLLAHPDLLRRHVKLVNPREQAWLVRDQTAIEGAEGDLVSLIPLGGDVRVRMTQGLQWPLVDETLFFGLARGVSNVMTASRATVTLASGLALCVHREGA